MGVAAVLWIPFALAVLLLLPIRVAAARLPLFAFGIWLLAGIALIIRGVLRFVSVDAAGQSTSITALAAVAIGLLKGRFVLSKTAARNRARLRALRGATRPGAVYSPTGWFMIAVFMCLGMALGWMGAPMIWRAGVSLAVGVALLVSSFDYLRS